MKLYTIRQKSMGLLLNCKRQKGEILKTFEQEIYKDYVSIYQMIQANSKACDWVW